MISFPVTLTATEGATPASSASSSALSISSLTTTVGQYSTSWPVSLISSLLEANSASREVRKVLRARLGAPRPVAATAITPSLSGAGLRGRPRLRLRRGRFVRRRVQMAGTMAGRQLEFTAEQALDHLGWNERLAANPE